MIHRHKHGRLSCFGVLLAVCFVTQAESQEACCLHLEVVSDNTTQWAYVGLPPRRNLPYLPGRCPGRAHACCHPAGAV